MAKKTPATDDFAGSALELEERELRALSAHASIESVPKHTVVVSGGYISVKNRQITINRDLPGRW